MIKRLAILTLVFMLLAVTAYAESKTLTIQATIPEMNGMDVAVSRIIGENWTPMDDVMNMGIMEFDDEWKVFRSKQGRYYAVDVGIFNNTGNWILTHTTSSVTNGTDNLDENINFSAMDEHGSAGLEGRIKYLSLKDSNGQTFTRADLTGDNWLRIYYGIATGKDDAPGVKPVGIGKNTGVYTGSVTLTLVSP